MKWLLIINSLLTIESIAIAGNLKIGSPAKVFKSSDGIKVSMIPVTDGAQKRFLLMFEGADSKINDLALLHSADKESTDTALYTFINDDKFYSLILNDDHTGTRNGTLALPEAPMKKISLKYDDVETKKLDGKTVLNKHLEQLKNGSISKIELSDEKDWKGHVNGVFRRAVNNAKSYCWEGIGGKVDWNSVDKKLYNKIPLATMCRQPVDALARTCREDSSKKLNSKVHGITCVVGKSQAISIGSDKWIKWTVPDAGVLDLDTMEQKFHSLIN